MNRETSFENTGQETSTDDSHTVRSLELHNDLIHCYNVPGVSDVTMAASFLSSHLLSHICNANCGGVNSSS